MDTNPSNFQSEKDLILASPLEVNSKFQVNLSLVGSEKIQEVVSSYQITQRTSRAECYDNIRKLSPDDLLSQYSNTTEVVKKQKKQCPDSKRSLHHNIQKKSDNTLPLSSKNFSQSVIFPTEVSRLKENLLKSQTLTSQIVEIGYDRQMNSSVTQVVSNFQSIGESYQIFESQMQQHPDFNDDGAKYQFISNLTQVTFKAQVQNSENQHNFDGFQTMQQQDLASIVEFQVLDDETDLRIGKTEQLQASDINVFSQSIANLKVNSFSDATVQNYLQDRIIDSDNSNNAWNKTSMTVDQRYQGLKVSQDTPILILNNSEISHKNDKKILDSITKVARSQNVFQVNLKSAEEQNTYNENHSQRTPNQKQDDSDAILHKCADSGIEGDGSFCKSEISYAKSGGELGQNYMSKIKTIQYTNIHSVDEAQKSQRQNYGEEQIQGTSSIVQSQPQETNSQQKFNREISSLQDCSQQMTRSALEKPNLIQQLSEPSDDDIRKENSCNQDVSGQSSAVSQYFRRNSETDEQIDEDGLQSGSIEDERIRIHDGSQRMNLDYDENLYIRRIVFDQNNQSISKQIIVEAAHQQEEEDDFESSKRKSTQSQKEFFQQTNTDHTPQRNTSLQSDQKKSVIEDQLLQQDLLQIVDQNSQINQTPFNEYGLLDQKHVRNDKFTDSPDLREKQYVYQKIQNKRQQRSRFDENVEAELDIVANKINESVYTIGDKSELPKCLTLITEGSPEHFAPEHFVKQPKKIGGKKGSRIESGIFIQQNEEVQKNQIHQLGQIIPKQKATLFSNPKFVGDKRISNASNTIQSTIQSSATARSQVNKVRSKSNPPQRKEFKQKESQKQKRDKEPPVQEQKTGDESVNIIIPKKINKQNKKLTQEEFSGPRFGVVLSDRTICAFDQNMEIQQFDQDYSSNEPSHRERKTQKKKKKQKKSHSGGHSDSFKRQRRIENVIIADAVKKNSEFTFMKERVTALEQDIDQPMAARQSNVSRPPLMPNVLSQLSSRIAPCAHKNKSHKRKPQTADLGFLEGDLDGKRREILPVRSQKSQLSPKRDQNHHSNITNGSQKLRFQFVHSKKVSQDAEDENQGASFVEAEKQNNEKDTTRWTIEDELSDNNNTQKMNQSRSQSSNTAGRSGLSKHTPKAKRSLPQQANRVVYNLKINLEERRERIKQIKEIQRQTYGINKDKRQIKTAKVGERIPGSRFFKPNETSIEWVQTNKTDYARHSSIQRHGLNVQSANLANNKNALLQEQLKLKQTVTTGAIFPSARYMFAQTAARTNIDVMSGSEGSTNSQKFETAFPPSGVNDEFINQTTIVLNNKAHRVKEFLQKRRQITSQTQPLSHPVSAQRQHQYEDSLLSMVASNKTQLPDEHQLPQAEHFNANFDLPYSGLTKNEIKDLSVDEIYQRMTRNLNLKNNMDFETRCQALFAPSPDAEQQRNLQIKLINRNLFTPSALPYKSTNFAFRGPNLIEEVDAYERTQIRIGQGQMLPLDQHLMRTDVMSSYHEPTNQTQPKVKAIMVQNGSTGRVIRGEQNESKPWKELFNQKEFSNFQSSEMASQVTGDCKRDGSRSILSLNEELRSVPLRIAGDTNYSVPQTSHGNRTRPKRNERQRIVSTDKFNISQNPMSHFDAKEARALQNERQQIDRFKCNRENQLEIIQFEQKKPIKSNKSNGPQSNEQSTKTDQEELRKRLQYRSMRGRRIKEFLAQVKTKHFNENIAIINKQFEDLEESERKIPFLQ